MMLLFDLVQWPDNAAILVKKFQMAGLLKGHFVLFYVCVSMPWVQASYHYKCSTLTTAAVL